MQPVFKYLIIGGVVLGGGFLGRKWILAAMEDASFDSADQGGSPGNIAIRLDQAFTWSLSTGNTDEEEIVRTVEAIRDKKTWEASKKAYSRQRGGSNLIADLQRDLDSEEYNTVQYIIDGIGAPMGTAKYRSWAARVHFWMDRGVERNIWFNPTWVFESPKLQPEYEERLFQILREIPQVAFLPAVLSTYKTLYSQSLAELLTKSLTKEHWATVRSIVMNKPDARGKQLHELFR